VHGVRVPLARGDCLAIVGGAEPAWAATPSWPASVAPAWCAAASADRAAWTDAGLFVVELDGELLADGDPLAEVLGEPLGAGDELGDDELLGDGFDDWVGLLLADPEGAGEFVRQFGETCAELLAGLLVPVPPPACELWCADPPELPCEP
jgi:hypothetical protein